MTMHCSWASYEITNADGNLLTETGDVNRSVTWTSYNKPSQITGNGAQETFVYGPDRSRLVTAITKGSDTVTTTYIDGLFEQVYDSSTGNLTYRHYILAGGTRVGVETINANSGGTITADTLSFYVHDEVGSVIATVTESLGGANQTVSLSSYDAWGKARATSGSTAYQDLPPGSFYSPTPSGQQEGFAGHDNLSDTGLVDMEGRVYDPEVGTFLSADPNVQYPFSSQGYDRYSYVNDNPLSLSDPSGYFSLGGMLSAGDPMAGFFPQQYGEVLSVVGPIVGAALNAVPGCQGWCDYVVTMASEAEAGYLETGSVGVGLRSGLLAGAEAYTFSFVGGLGWDGSAGNLIAKSFAEGLVGGAFSSAGGGRFSDGFLGAFVGSESSGLIGQIGGNPNEAEYFSANNESLRVVVSMLAGGTASRLAGGNFTEGALAAAFQRIFNDDEDARKDTAERENLAKARRVFAEMYKSGRLKEIGYGFIADYPGGLSNRAFSFTYVPETVNGEDAQMDIYGFTGAKVFRGGADTFMDALDTVAHEIYHLNPQNIAEWSSGNQSNMAWAQQEAVWHAQLVDMTYYNDYR